MSFSSRITKSAEKVSRLRAELAAAELEHRELRAQVVVERLGKIKGDTVRPTGFGGPVYSRSDLENQARSPYTSNADLDRLEALVAGHEASS